MSGGTKVVANSRKIVRTLKSGFPAVVHEVDIYDFTIVKVKEGHPPDFAHFDHVISTIEGAATSVHQSKTADSAVVLVNANVTNRSGDHLRVPIKVFSDRTGI